MFKVIAIGVCMLCVGCSSRTEIEQPSYVKEITLEDGTTNQSTLYPSRIHLINFISPFSA